MSSPQLDDECRECDCEGEMPYDENDPGAYPGPDEDCECEFRRLTGVPLDAHLTLPGWARWVFRELQAARATTDGVSTKRRTRKA